MGLKKLLKKIEKHVIRPVVHTVVAPITRTHRSVHSEQQAVWTGNPTAEATAYVLTDIPVADIGRVLSAEGIPESVADFVADNIEAQQHVVKDCIVSNGTSWRRYHKVDAKLCGGTVRVEYVLAHADVEVCATTAVTTTTRKTVLGIRTHRSSESRSVPRGLTVAEEQLIVALLARAAGEAMSNT